MEPQVMSVEEIMASTVSRRKRASMDTPADAGGNAVDPNLMPTTRDPNKLLGEAEASALAGMLAMGEKVEKEDDKDTDKETGADKMQRLRDLKKGGSSSDSDTEKPTEPEPDKDTDKEIPESTTLKWIKSAIAEALDDVKEDRRTAIEDKVWLRLLINKIGDGEPSDATKRAITVVVAQVLGGRETEPEQLVAPAPIDLDNIDQVGKGDTVMARTESDGVVMGRVIDREHRFATIEIDTGKEIRVRVSDLTLVDLNDDVLDKLIDDPTQLDSLIDGFVGG